MNKKSKRKTKRPDSFKRGNNKSNQKLKFGDFDIPFETQITYENYPNGTEYSLNCGSDLILSYRFSGNGIQSLFTRITGQDYLRHFGIERNRFEEVEFSDISESRSIFKLSEDEMSRIAIHLESFPDCAKENNIAVYNYLMKEYFGGRFQEILLKVLGLVLQESYLFAQNRANEMREEKLFVKKEIDTFVNDFVEEIKQDAIERIGFEENRGKKQISDADYNAKKEQLIKSIKDVISELKKKHKNRLPTKKEIACKLFDDCYPESKFSKNLRIFEIDFDKILSEFV